MNKISSPLPVESNSMYSFKSLSKGISLFVTGVGCLVLIGWAWNIAALKSILPGLASMKSNAALLFILSGISLWTQVKGKTWRIAKVCAFIVTLGGFLTLGEYMLNRDFGIDQFLFRDYAIGSLHPGRMAPSTALAFLLIGLALLFLERREKHFNQSLVITAFAISGLALIGYIYGVSSLYQIGLYSSMALHTALSFVLLSMGILFARPARGLMQTILADTPGGNILRRLLPVVILGPVLLGWITLWGQRAGLYDTAFGLAIMVISLITTLTVFIWLNAGQLTALDIKRKWTNAALLEREMKLTKLFEILPVGISILDEARKVSYTNPALKKILDISEEGLLQGTYRNRKYLRADGTLIPVDELASARAFKEKREINSVETGVVKEDNSIVWTDVSAVPVDFPDWKVVMVTSDITEHKQAEMALSRERKLLRTLVDNMPAEVYVKDRERRFLLVNELALHALGVQSMHKVIGKRDEDFMPSELARQFAEEEDEIMSTGKPLVNDEYTSSNSQGQKQWFMRTKLPLRDEAGNIIGLAGLGNDITERKQAEEDLRSNERRLHLAAAAGGVGLWDWDVVKDELIWDDSMYSLYSIQKKDFSGAYHAWTSTLHPDDRQFTESEIQAALRGEREYAPEFRIVRPDGAIRVLKATSQTIRDQDGKALRMIGTNIDITERKRAEEEILELNADLEKKVVERTAELATANQKLQELAIVDELTGLYNRRGFLLHAGQQLLLARRTERNLLIFYADLDGLKQINDDLGHTAGDKAIISAARVLREAFRTSDIKARLGGDEFIVLAVETNRDYAQVLLARLNEKLAENDQSMSVGFVPVDAQKDMSIDDIIARADQAMYAEKRRKSGHNRM
jgi:diguanylate cyclase (GGDEF)-like protein/PAS domain S-box-containing protein